MSDQKKPVLDLCITHWTEDWSVGKKAFTMLGLQRMIDWDDVRVTLIHDGVDMFPDEYFADLPFIVHQVCIPHGGPGAARNWIIDHGSGEWIKWCDFDDMLYGVYSLRSLMDALKTGQDYDYLWFDMTGETIDGSTRYLRSERDPVLIHAKAFRRSFLIDHGIRYNVKLTYCEDSAFLALVEMEINHKRIGHVSAEAPIYAWIVRDGSLCNRPDIHYSNVISFFERHKYVQDEFLRHGKMGPYYTMTARIMGDCYKHLFLEDLKASQEEVDDFLQMIADYYKEHRDDLFKLSANQYELAINAVEDESVYTENGKAYKKHIDRDEFKRWLRSIRDKNAGEVEKDVCV